MDIRLEENIKICNQIFDNCDIDFHDLADKKIDEVFFEDYNNTRIVNSFLFNFAKLQDKIGAKLFKFVLYEIKEIDSFNISMIDVLNHLERLEIIDNQHDWDVLRELRNLLAHEYPFDSEERSQNIQLVLEGYLSLKSIYKRLIHAIK